MLSLDSRALARPHSVTRSLLRLWFALAQRYPAPYFGLCLLLGLLLRYRLAAGDWSLVLDPRFPLMRWLG